MLRKLPILFIFIIPLIASAQKLDMSLVKNMQPRNIGPAGMSGRVTAIDAVTSNPDIIYAGSASGGLWKSTSGGVTWKPVFDDQETASIGSVAIQQSNPSVVWVGTGEGNPRNSVNSGHGIFKSLDGGKTWKNMGLENTRNIYRVIIDPTNPDVVYAGAIGSPWGDHPERGVFKTTDGGKSWKKVLFVNNRTGTADLVMDPNNPNKLIAAMWEHHRDPFFFKSGGKGSGLYITYDGGENWKKLKSEDGLPEGELGRIGLAIAPSKSDVVYAYVESKKNALYRSDNGGESWKMVNNDMNEIGNRPFYYADIYVAPDNENRVYSIFTYVNVSEDGGKSFKELMPSYGSDNGVHPDHHAWYIHPTNPDFMMDGNDGGLYITRDGGDTWRFAENIPVGQFYHVAVDNDYPYNVYGGMQDNGSWRGPAYVLKSQGIRNSYWQEISFGDGFDVVPDPTDVEKGWSMSQQGYVGRFDAKTGNNYSVRPTHPDPDVQLRFNWNSAIALSPFQDKTLYFGSQFVHRTFDGGLTWEVISPDLTRNDPEQQKQAESGGLTLDATGAENYNTIIVIEPSEAEMGLIWTGSDDGRVHVTRDGGGHWTDLTANIKDLPQGSWIAQIRANKNIPGQALLIANNYRRNDYTPYAYRTKDYGKTWERIVDGSDVKSYTLSIIEDAKVPELMFLGTDDGLYVSIDAAATWTKWTEGFPTVPVKDMVIHPRENDLVIATFGRSFWVLDDIKPLRALARNSSMLNNFENGKPGTVQVFPPTEAYQNAYQQPTGTRFAADAIYSGVNRPTGAKISYFIRPNTAKDAEKKWDTVKLNIYDKGRLIRTLKTKAPEEAGLYNFRWYMDEKGADRPSRTIRKSDRERGGLSVRPGSYEVEVVYGTEKSSETINVKSDPRLNQSKKTLEDIYYSGKDLEKSTQIAADAVEQLVQSKNTAQDFIKRMKDAGKDQYEAEIKASEEIIKKIDNEIALFIGKEDDRQGIVRSPEQNVMTRIGTASSYISSRPEGLTDTENRLLAQAKDELREALASVNTFYEEEWPGYQDTIQALDLSPFKEVQSFSID